MEQMHLGFSYIGVIFLAMLFVPNIIWAKNQPQGYEESSKKENKILLLLERIGEVLACSILVFSDCNIRIRSIWLFWLILCFLLLILYECYWVRYFKSNRTLMDMYASFAGFPVAGASLPVIALFCLGVYALNIFIILTSVILGIGHIGIHLAHRKDAMDAQGIKKEKTKKQKIGRIIKIVVLVPVTVLLLGLSILIGIRNVNFFTCQYLTRNGIDEEFYVDIGGQEQFITIRGTDENAPLILYLHGGPGSPDSFYSFAFTNELIDDYTVVCWDQRGSGRTYVKNDDKDNETVSFPKALSDLDELVSYLTSRFGQEKIILMGHSYGSILGSRYAYDHPEKISAYIGVGQYVCADSALRYEYEDALSQANASGKDTTKLMEAYDVYLQDPTLENSTKVSDLCAPYHNAPRQKNIIFLALGSPTLGTEDLLWYINLTSFDAFQKYNRTLIDYMMEVDLRESQIQYEVPVFFISGACDYNCAFEDMIAYSDLIGAKYDLIEGCGHNVQYDDSEEFARIVKEDLNTI